MLAHTSVYRTWAPAAAAIGSVVISIAPPVSAAICEARSTTCGMGANPAGVATRNGHGRLRPGQQQRVRDVVPVADVGEHRARQGAAMLADREQVRQGLTRVLEIRQRVHDRHVGGGGKHLQALLFEGAQHDRVHVPGQHAARVLDRLSATELQIGGRQGERVPPELPDADLEGDPCAGRRLLEDEGDGLADQRRCMEGPIRLHPTGELEDARSSSAARGRRRTDSRASWAESIRGLARPVSPSEGSRRRSP